MARYLGNGVPEVMLDWQPALPVLLATAVDGADIVELGWRRLGGNAVLLAHTRDGQRLPQEPDGAAPQFSDASLGFRLALLSSSFGCLDADLSIVRSGTGRQFPGGLLASPETNVLE